MGWRIRDAVYEVIYFCLRSAQPEFFRRVQVLGQPLDDPSEHLVVVANHPYGIEDAFLISFAYTRPFYFVATAMNFQKRDGDVIQKKRLKGWFLRQCHVLPIVRDRSEGHMSDNVRTFEAAARRIAEGYALGIFAEGDSRGNQWKLLKLKRGSAQIALQVADLLKAEDKQLKIQVVGLTYTNWDQPFKSTVTLNFAEPLVVEPVDMGDRQAVRAARKAITDDITGRMRQLTVEIPEEHQSLVGKIARFYCIDERNDYVRLLTVGKKVAELSDRHAGDREALEQMLDEYLELAEELHIYPGEERASGNPLALLPMAAPAYAGYVLHWPILWATRKTIPPEETELHVLGSRWVTWGIGFTLAWYALLGLVFMFVGVSYLGWWGVPVAIGAFLLVACCGLVASQFFRHVNLAILRLWPGSRRFKRFQRLGTELLAKLEALRGA